MSEEKPIIEAPIAEEQNQPQASIKNPQEIQESANNEEQKLEESKQCKLFHSLARNLNNQKQMICAGNNQFLIQSD